MVGDWQFKSTDLRERKTSVKVSSVTWDLANSDPHFIRLGKYLAHSQGIKNPGIQLEEKLEKEYLRGKEDERNTTLIITKVVDPQMSVKAFIHVWTNGSQLHSQCPFDKLIRSEKQKKTDTSKTVRGLPIPGLPDCVEVSNDKSDFNLTWVQKKKERRGRLADVFSWATKPTQQHQPSEASKAAKSPRPKPDSTANQCKEKIDRSVRTVLLSKYKPAEIKTVFSTPKDPVHLHWDGQRDCVSEKPQTRKPGVKPLGSGSWKPPLPATEHEDKNSETAQDESSITPFSTQVKSVPVLRGGGKRTKEEDIRCVKECKDKIRGIFRTTDEKGREVDIEFINNSRPMVAIDSSINGVQTSSCQVQLKLCNPDWAMDEPGVNQKFYMYEGHGMIKMSSGRKLVKLTESLGFHVKTDSVADDPGLGKKLYELKREIYDVDKNEVNKSKNKKLRSVTTYRLYEHQTNELNLLMNMRTTSSTKDINMTFKKVTQTRPRMIVIPQYEQQYIADALNPIHDIDFLFGEEAEMKKQRHTCLNCKKLFNYFGTHLRNNWMCLEKLGGNRLEEYEEQDVIKALGIRLDMCTSPMCQESAFRYNNLYDHIEKPANRECEKYYYFTSDEHLEDLPDLSQWSPPVDNSSLEREDECDGLHDPNKVVTPPHSPHILRGSLHKDSTLPRSPPMKQMRRNVHWGDDSGGNLEEVIEIHPDNSTYSGSSEITSEVPDPPVTLPPPLLAVCSPMVHQAVNHASRHGIEVEWRYPNSADGNCAPESVVIGINCHQMFLQKITCSPTDFKAIAVSEYKAFMEMHCKDELDAYLPGMNQSERDAKWRDITINKTWAIPFFGDIVVPAMARHANARVLILCTNPGSMKPIQVINPEDQIGGKISVPDPIILAYDGSHYESLQLSSDESHVTAKDVFVSVHTGTYKFTQKDIPFLTSDQEIRVLCYAEEPLCTGQRSMCGTTTDTICIQCKIPLCESEKCSQLEPKKKRGRIHLEGNCFNPRKVCMKCEEEFTNFGNHLHAEKNNECLNYYSGEKVTPDKKEKEIIKIGLENKMCTNPTCTKPAFQYKTLKPHLNVRGNNVDQGCKAYYEKAADGKSLDEFFENVNIQKAEQKRSVEKRKEQRSKRKEDIKVQERLDHKLTKSNFLRDQSTILQTFCIMCRCFYTNTWSTRQSQSNPQEIEVTNGKVEGKYEEHIDQNITKNMMSKNSYWMCRKCHRHVKNYENTINYNPDVKQTKIESVTICEKWTELHKQALMWVTSEDPILKTMNVSGRSILIPSYPEWQVEEEQENRDSIMEIFSTINMSDVPKMIDDIRRMKEKLNVDNTAVNHEKLNVDNTVVSHDTQVQIPSDVRYITDIDSESQLTGSPRWGPVSRKRV